jgi:uncharacterized protein (DUF58 family)
LRRDDHEVSLEWHRRLPLFVIFLLIVLEIVFSSRAWMTILLGFGGILVISAWWAWQLTKGIQVSRQVRFPLVQVGDLMEERFVLTNQSVLPALWVEIRDQSNIPGYTADTVRAVGGQSDYRWVTRGECRQRGEYHLGPWEAITWDPFGLFAVVQRSAKVQDVLVYPSIARELPFPLPRGARSGWAHVSHRSLDPTVNVGGVRAYVPGDPQRHIHWPTTARRDGLYAKQFDQETGGDVWLVLDLDESAQVGSGERSTEELSVTVASSVAALMLDARRAVGLIAHGGQTLTVIPERGRAHLWRLLQALARAHPGREKPLNQVLESAARVIPTGATALIITPSLEADWLPGLARLEGQGIGVAAVLIDADSFSELAEEGAGPRSNGAGGRERLLGRAESLRWLLADAGTSAEIVDADTALALRPPTGQVRRWEFKVLGTGRAIAVSTPWGE